VDSRAPPDCQSVAAHVQGEDGLPARHAHHDTFEDRGRGHLFRLNRFIIAGRATGVNEDRPGKQRDNQKARAKLRQDMTNVVGAHRCRAGLEALGPAGCLGQISPAISTKPVRANPRRQSWKKRRRLDSHQGGELPPADAPTAIPAQCDAHIGRRSRPSRCHPSQGISKHDRRVTRPPPAAVR